MCDRVLNTKQSFGGVLLKKGFLKIFANFTRNHLCWSLFLIKLQALRPATLLKSDSNTAVFLWNLQKNLRTLNLKNICEQLLLTLESTRKEQSKGPSKLWTVAAEARIAIVRRSCRRVFYKKDVFKEFAKFAGKQSCRSFVLILLY